MSPGQILDEDAYTAAVRLFVSDCNSQFRVLPFAPIIVEAAEGILREHGAAAQLRTLDALQMAFFANGCAEDTIFLCSDKRLIERVSVLGWTVEDPTEA